MNPSTNCSLVIDILTEAFQNNPSVLTSIHPKKPKALHALSLFAFLTGQKRQGIYISKDQNGVAICYQYNLKKETLSDYWNQFLLVKNAIGFSRVLSIMKREAYIKKQRPADGNFLYFWFFGVKTQGRGKGAALEIKHKIFQESEDKQLPIYLETSVEKNKNAYERYGFKVYHTWEETPDQAIWFMRRTPS